MDEARRLIELTNDRLRKGKVGASLELQGVQDWIYVRATLPPKPNSRKTRYHQQRIALHIRANSREAVRTAEAIARQIGLDLNLGNFSWAKFNDTEFSNTKLVSDWIIDLEDWFWNNRERNPSTLNTWTKAYAGPLKLLPVDRELTIELLQDWVIENSSPRTRRRGHYCTCAAQLAKMAGFVGVDFKELASGYSQKPINPRDLPSDEEITRMRNSIKDPGWRYLFGLMAAYGLRNHECFALDMEEFPIVRVRSGTKTGGRPIKPLYPEWAEQWQLNEIVLPRRAKFPEDLELAGNAFLGNKITRFFKNSSIGGSAYNLRHCYARRCAEFGIPPATASRLMGHSLHVHESVYKAWIGERVHLDIVDRVVERGDRPMPPIS